MRNYNITLTEKQQKHQHYHLEKLINVNILQVKNQRRVIEQAKFTYSPLGKAFEKQTKTIEDQGKMQIKEIEYHRKQIIESNELIKKDFNIDRDGVPLKEQKKYLMNLLKKNLMNLKK